MKANEIKVTVDEHVCPFGGWMFGEEPECPFGGWVFSW